MFEQRTVEGSPLRVVLIGTGYAAKLRAEAFSRDPRAQLVAIAGQNPDRTEVLAQQYGVESVAEWQQASDRVDLVVMASANHRHGAVVRSALDAGKHVVVEYPLALDLMEAAALIDLARASDRLLHVEHIELLGGVHQALKANLAAIGPIFWAQYATVKPERPAPAKWTYDCDQFGFPLIGALSRVHRLIDLFGPVARVTCQARFLDAQGRDVAQGRYVTCLCQAQLHFQSGIQAEVIYGKGEAMWTSRRCFEVQGQLGELRFEGNHGTRITAEGSSPIAVGGRTGLFQQDTARVLDYLTKGTPLYVTPEESLYTLKVADAARRSALTGEAIGL